MDMTIKASCLICGTNSETVPPAETARIRSNVKEFSAEVFTVWRCGHCRSLHCLEQVDLAKYYARYPVHRQKYDFFAKRIYKRRLRFLCEAGLKKGDTLLDYGCGSGYFVRYAREKGILAEGYDPYSSGEFRDPGVLLRKYDFVTAQDVIEHDEDPQALLEKMKGYVKPGGSLAVGTPNAEKIDLEDPLAPLDAVHMPYHRHIYTRRELEEAMLATRLQVVSTRQESYFDTPFPFVNLPFLVRLFRAGGNVLDAGFEPVLPVLVRHPMLLFWGLFGRWFPRGNDMIVIARSK